MLQALTKLLWLLPLLVSGCICEASHQQKSVVVSLPDELRFQTVYLPVTTGFCYRLDHTGILTREEAMGPPHYRVKTLRRRVTPQAWHRFEESLAPLHLRRWKHEYYPRPEYAVTDGGNWYLTWVAHGHRVTSAGYDAVPEAENPAKTLDEGSGAKTNGVFLLTKALDDLWEHSTTSH